MLRPKLINIYEIRQILIDLIVFELENKLICEIKLYNIFFNKYSTPGKL